MQSQIKPHLKVLLLPLCLQPHIFAHKKRAFISTFQGTGPSSDDGDDDVDDVDDDVDDDDDIYGYSCLCWGSEDISVISRGNGRTSAGLNRPACWNSMLAIIIT